MKLITEEEAAERLTVKVGTLRDWRTDKKGPPFIKMVGTVRYRPTDLDKWVDQQLVDFMKGNEDEN